jgi:flagellar motor switch protein FliM
MTSPSVDHLGNSRIRRLLAAVGSAPAPQQPAGNVTPYDWRDPHYFNIDQLNRVAAAMSRTAAGLAAVFTRFFSREFDAAPTAVTQHFAGDLDRCFDADNSYCATFGPEKGPGCGFLAISSPTAVGWGSRLLGDAESAAHPDRALSPLEESLLSDLVAGVLDNILAPLQPHGPLQGIGPLSKGKPAVRFERTEEICRIAFRIKEAGKDESSEITFVLSCGRLAALVGRTPPASPATAQEISQALMEHFQEMPVTVTARLAVTEIEFQEILDLGPGDILLLDKPVSAPAELTAEGRTVLLGRPVQSGGRYAMFIEDFQAGRPLGLSHAVIPAEPRKG